MEKTNWIPAAQRYYCTGCKSTRKIPPSASSIFHSKCGKCKKPVAISMAETVTYLSCIIAPDCKGATLESPIRLDCEGKVLIMWIQDFMTKVMLLWKNGVISHTSELTAGLPSLEFTDPLMHCKSTEIEGMQIAPIMWPTWTVEPDPDIVVMEVDEVFSDVESETTETPHIAVKHIANDSNNNSSQISESITTSPTLAMSSQAAHQDEPPPLEEEDSRNSLLDYELEGEEDAEMTGEEVVVEEPEVKKKKRRTRRGSGQERKERNERLRQGELITIAREEYDSLRKLPEEVKEMKKRLEEVERALKRASTGKESQTPAKKPKLGPPTLREKLCMHPHLINSAYFHNWWGKHSAKPIWGPRAIAELANLGIPKSSLERLDPHALSEVYCLVTSRLLEQGAIDRLPAFVPKCYANKGLTMSLVIEKITILSPVISSFILSEKRLFEVDARRAGAVALMLQSKPKNLVITKNDARHKLNSGKARGAKNLPSTSWKETDHLPRHKLISSTSHNSHTFSEEIVKTITGPPPVCSFSKKSNDPIINFNADKGVQRVVAPEEAVEIIEEDYTETGSKSDEESATCEDENLDGECGYFSTDRRVFEEELRPRIVVPLQPTILSEFDVEPDVLIKEGNAEDSQNIGESSHSSRRQMSRGRRESKSPEPRDRRHCVSMSPERVSRVSTKSKISSKNSSNSKSITRRNNSLLAEVRIPGHVSEATRKARGGAPSFLKTREFSPDRAKHRQHDRHQPRDGEDRHHHRH